MISQLKIAKEPSFWLLLRLLSDFISTMLPFWGVTHYSTLPSHIYDQSSESCSACLLNKIKIVNHYFVIYWLLLFLGFRLRYCLGRQQISMTWWPQQPRRGNLQQRQRSKAKRSFLFEAPFTLFGLNYVLQNWLWK